MEINNGLKIKVGIVALIIIVIGTFLIVYNLPKEDEESIELLKSSEITLDTSNISKEIIHVDIKGAVKKPGVYKMEIGSIVQDVIMRAGGLKTNAYTKNINLAQVLKNEMVIYIFSNSEIKKATEVIVTDTTCKCEVIEVNNCTSEKTTTNNKSLVNINTATLEELLTISGIGESKAKSIIEYRNTNKFTSIEDIKNVSGIGESLFVKIKDYITV